MRAGLALIAALALCVTPAVAQGKVKSKGGADIGATLGLDLALRDGGRHAEGQGRDEGETGAHRASPAPP